MAYDKRIRKHVLKRRFTVTRTKAVIGFVFSVFFSVLLSTYFEEYGRDIYSQSKAMLLGSNKVKHAKAEKPEEVEEYYEDVSVDEASNIDAGGDSLEERDTFSDLRDLNY